jgi:O-antigen ligase
MLASELISYGIFFELFTYKNVPASNPSPFMKHLEYSIFLAFAALVTLSRLIFEKSNKYKLLYALFFTSLTINLFITGGRSGQLAFVVSMVVLFLYNYENKLKALLVSTLLGAIILTAAYNTSDLFHARVNKAMTDVSSVLDDSNYCSSWGTRAGALIIAKDIFLEHPLIGVGTIDNIDLLRETIDSKYEYLSCMRWYMHFHNQYAEVLTEVGLIGLALFLWMFYRIFSIPLRDKQFIAIKIILVSVFLVGFIAEPYLHAQFTLALFSLILGILLAQSRVDNDDAPALSVEPADSSLDIEPANAVLAGDFR